MGIRTTAKLLAVSAVAISGATITNTGSASATAYRGNVEITPHCSDASKGFSIWKANNKNHIAVTINWKNLSTHNSGSYVAEAGESYFSTQYTQNEKNEINNATTFTMPEAGDEVARNAVSHFNAQCEVEDQPQEDNDETVVTPVAEPDVEAGRGADAAMVAEAVEPKADPAAKPAELADTGSRSTVAAIAAAVLTGAAALVRLPQRRFKSNS